MATGISPGRKSRSFNVMIYEEDCKELCAWVLKKPNIETGGDLFGLWADKHTAVIQLVLGPGQECRRTTASFYQDIDYLQRVGSYLTQNEGVCHIGEWHSHPQYGLARPSGGDERAVKNTMLKDNLKRFVIFIAKLQSPEERMHIVHIGCFLCGIDDKENRLKVLPGEFTVLQNGSPLSGKVSEEKNKGAEDDDENKIANKDLKLEVKEGEKSPSVTYSFPLVPFKKVEKKTEAQRSQVERAATTTADQQSSGKEVERKNDTKESLSQGKSRPKPNLAEEKMPGKKTERQKVGGKATTKAGQASRVKGVEKKFETKEIARRGVRPPKPMEKKSALKIVGKPLQTKVTAKKRDDQQSSSKKAGFSGSGSKTGIKTSKFLHSVHCYSMENRPRGDCVIINNVIFHDETQERKGADVDERELKELFEMLFFAVTVHNNLKWYEMGKVANEFAKKDHKQHDGFVLVVMSHGGSRDVIHGADGGEIKVEDLMSQFKVKNSPTLKDKPKMFFIQSCRGLMEEISSVPVAASSTDAFTPDSTLPNSICPQEADFLFAFSTSPGYVALRDEKKGSWFVQILVEVMRKYHSSDHLLDILTEVNRLVMERGVNTPSMQLQCPAPVHTLRRKVYL